MIRGVIWSHWSSTQKLIPVDVLRTLWRLLGPGNALWPNRPVGPNVDFLDRAEQVRLDRRDALAEPVFGGTLVAHLRAEVLLCRELSHHASFLNGPGQWL